MNLKGDDLNKKYIYLILVIYLIQFHVYANEYDDNCTSSSIDTYCLDLRESMAYEKVDKDLNIIYKKIITKLSSKEEKNNFVNYNELKQSLIKAQKQWIVFRDLDCNAWSNINEMGTGRNQTEMQCLKNRTIDRIKQLNQWMQEL